MKIKIILCDDNGKNPYVMYFKSIDDSDDAELVAFAETIKAYLLTKLSKPDFEQGEQGSEVI